MENHSITIQLAPEVEAQLAALAAARKQAVSDVAADVIASYVAIDSPNGSMEGRIGRKRMKGQ